MTPIESYIFWTYPWTDIPSPVKQMNPKYTLCQIDNTSLRLVRGGDTLCINLSEVESCKRRLFSGGGALDGVTWVEITLPNNILAQKHKLTTNRLCVSAMNPLTGFKSELETRRMIEVINSLRDGKTPDIHPNPYYRALTGVKRGDEFSEEKWDPTKPPPTYSTMPSWKSVLPTLTIAIGAAIAMILLGFLLEYIFAF